MKKSTIWLIAIVLFAVLFISQEKITSFLIPIFGGVVSKVIIVSIAVLLFLSEHIVEFFIARREEKIKRERIEGYVGEIATFFSEYIKMPIKSIIIEQEDLSRSEVYVTYLSKLFPTLATDRRNSLILLALVNKFSESRTPEFYDLIQTYNGLLDIPQLNKRSKQFLTALVRIIRRDNIKNVEDFFSTPYEINFNKALRYYVEQFSKHSAFIYIREDLNRAEELRSTLIELYNRGKLPTLSIRKKAVRNLEKALQKRKIYTKTYVLIGNKLPSKLKEYLSKMPLLKEGATRSRNIPSKPDRLFSLYVVKSEEIDSLDDFYEKIKSFIQKDQPIILTIAPLDFTSARTYVFPEDTKFSSKELKACNEALNYFRTGYFHIDVDIWSIISASDMEISELLSVIPFNIFVPDIKPRERELIITHYDDIKYQFNVELLEDWKGKDKELLASFLASLSLDRYKIPPRRCIEIAESVIENSKNFSNSLMPLDFRKPFSIDELVEI